MIIRNGNIAINSSGRIVYAVSTILVSLYSDPMCRVVDKDQPICMQVILQKLLQIALNMMYIVLTNSCAFLINNIVCINMKPRFK